MNKDWMKWMSGGDETWNVYEKLIEIKKKCIVGILMTIMGNKRKF